MRVAVLGTGIMGAGMARSLLRAGLDVTAWNRHPGRAAPLAADGTRLKLVANSWVGTIVAATAQSIALAEGLGLDPRMFLDMMQGSAVDAPYLHVKGEAIIEGRWEASFAVDGAAKDAGLIADAMRATCTDASLMEAVAGQYRKAAAAGHGEQDMAAVFHAFRP